MRPWRRRVWFKPAGVSLYGWSQDVVDGALIVLANAGQLRVTGEDGKPASLPDIPRQKIGTCTYRAETTIITVAQRVAVRGLLTEAGVPFENGQEAFALSALLDRLQSAAQQSGGSAPAPEPESVPDLPKYKSLSGNDLLAALAENAASLRDKLKTWQAASSKTGARLPNWSLAERLVRLGANDLESDLSDIRNGRKLLGGGSASKIDPLISDLFGCLLWREAGGEGC